MTKPRPYSEVITVDPMAHIRRLIANYRCRDERRDGLIHKAGELAGHINAFHSLGLINYDESTTLHEELRAAAAQKFSWS